MLKKLTLILLFISFSFVLVNAQSLEVKTYGISDRGVAADSNDIFDIKYNGLSNVGVGTKIYLVGNIVDAAFSSPLWTITAKPATSNAVIIGAEDLDEDSKAVSLVIDVEGTYVIELTDGALSASMTINGAKYQGLSETGVSCITCHNNKFFDFIPDKWQGTLHANAVQPNVDDPAGHFNNNCMKCHTTGYDANADNDGFDDFDFVFPSPLAEGNYDALLANYPDAMQRANVQCEACHGPGSGHNGVTDDNKIAVSTATSVCAYCHDSGTHHAIPALFDESGIDASDFDGRGFEGGHARGSFVGYAGGRAACAPCHSGTGYIEWIKEGRPSDDLGLPAGVENLPEPANFTCVTCHDPHDATNPHQLRAKETTLGDGTVISFEKFGTGAQCMDCHRSRRQASTYADDIKNQSSHFGAHHGPQADMLLGKNAPNFGIDFPSSPHAYAVVPGEERGNACVNCHMAGESSFDANGDLVTFGGHTFNMNNEEGEDNVEACAPCHGEIGKHFKDKKFYINGSADLDGNGVAEGLQLEVHGLLDKLGEFLPKDADGNVSITLAADSLLTPAKLRAGYIYFFVEEDRSFGIHNPQFTVAILKAAIDEMGGTTGINYANDELPNDYSLEQNYPNPFNPSTTIRFSVPQAGNVKVSVYDILGKEVDVLVNKDMNAGVFNVNWDASRYASGIYFYRMQANDFVSVKKMILVK